MRHIELPLEQIKPYERNPRDNREAVKYVCESIRRFGYRNYILVDSDYVIIAGHTRYFALRHLGWVKCQVYVADDMTPEQVKAYRLADNKVAEYAKWDKSYLDLELADLKEIGFSMLEFGFEVPDLVIQNDPLPENDETYYGDERERTNSSYNLEYFDPDHCSGDFQMPTLAACSHVPEHLINFNEVLTSTDYGAGVHFFIDDYRFERVWNLPERYVPILKRFDCVFTPDFSLYMDMPLAMMIWNVYRSRLIGRICRNAGMKVIPTVSWAGPESYDFCFDGIEPGGAVAVSTVGVMRNSEAREIFMDGMAAMIESCRPSTILMYGKPVPEACRGIPYTVFDNENQKRLSAIGGK